MPLEITISPRLQRNQSYATIGQTGYGRMNETTPYGGLATFGASSCTIIITHCSQLKRTTLIHSPNYMVVKPTLEPIFDWTVGKGEDAYIASHSMDVVVIRGYLYRDQLYALAFNHEGFVTRLRGFIEETYATHSVHITDAEPLLETSNGSLFVDKSAKITILRMPIPLSDGYNLQQLSREIFASDLFPFIYPNNGKIIKSRHLQFDVDRYNVHSKISNDCRLVLRAKCSLNYTDNELKDLLHRMNIDIDEMTFVNLKQALENPDSSGQPCERCPSKGAMKCANCNGAWYCGRVHQREDWPEHKSFCKLYAVKK